MGSLRGEYGDGRRPFFETKPPGERPEQRWGWSTDPVGLWTTKEIEQGIRDRAARRKWWQFWRR